jgi:hypothetical protein
MDSRGFKRVIDVKFIKQQASHRVESSSYSTNEKSRPDFYFITGGCARYQTYNDTIANSTWIILRDIGIGTTYPRFEENCKKSASSC